MIKEVLNQENIFSRKFISNQDSDIELKTKKIDDKDPTDSDSITDNETSDSLTSFIAALDHYDAILTKRKQDKLNTFASF
jgi:hypothetical protein